MTIYLKKTRDRNNSILTKCIFFVGFWIQLHIFRPDPDPNRIPALEKKVFFQIYFENIQIKYKYWVLKDQTQIYKIMKYTEQFVHLKFGKICLYNYTMQYHLMLDMYWVSKKTCPAIYINVEHNIISPKTCITQ